MYKSTIVCNYEHLYNHLTQTTQRQYLGSLGTSSVISLLSVDGKGCRIPIAIMVNQIQQPYLHSVTPQEVKWSLSAITATRCGVSDVHLVMSVIRWWVTLLSQSAIIMLPLVILYCSFSMMQSNYTEFHLRHINRKLSNLLTHEHVSQNET